MKAFMLLSKNGYSNDGVNDQSKNIYKTVKPPSYPPRKFTKAHLHGLLTELISEPSVSEQNEVNSPKDEPYSESIFLVKSTSANATNLGYVRKLMSTPGKGKATSNKK